MFPKVNKIIIGRRNALSFVKNRTLISLKLERTYFSS